MFLSLINNLPYF